MMRSRSFAPRAVSAPLILILALAATGCDDNPTEPGGQPGDGAWRLIYGSNNDNPIHSLSVVGNRAYAGGDHHVSFFDGSNWTLVPGEFSLAPVAIYAASGNSIFIGNDNGEIQHFDGTAWTPMVSGVEGAARFAGAWGTSAGDVYMFGSSGTVLHYDGASWEPMDTGTSTVNFYDMWGTSATSLWLSGSAGNIYFGDGTTWTPVDQPLTAGGLSAIWASGPNDLYAASGPRIVHYDGSDWSEGTVGENVRDLYGTGPTNVYAVGDNGAIFHNDGKQWNYYSQDSGTTRQLTHLSPLSQGLFALGSGAAVRRQGNGWTSLYPDFGSLLDVWASSPVDVFALCWGAIMHFDGRSWKESGVNYGWLEALWGTSGSNVYAVGDGYRIWRFNGSVWLEQHYEAVPARLHDILGASASDIYAVGNQKIMHWDGASWQDETAPAADLNALWMSPGGDWYAAANSGTTGLIYQRVGADWVSQPIPSTGSLVAIWGSAADNIFAAGGSGSMIHYDGQAWESMNSTTTENLWDLYGKAANDVYAVGDAGTVLHYDGSAWSPFDIGTRNQLYAVTEASGTWFIGGGNGVPSVLRR